MHFGLNGDRLFGPVDKFASSLLIADIRPISSSLNVTVSNKLTLYVAVVW